MRRSNSNICAIVAEPTALTDVDLCYYILRMPRFATDLLCHAMNSYNSILYVTLSMNHFRDAPCGMIHDERSVTSEHTKIEIDYPAKLINDGDDTNVLRGLIGN